jgi:hypothetical protein
MAKRKKRLNNDLQNTIQKSKDLVTGTPLESGEYSSAHERQVVPAPHMVLAAC